MVNVVTRTVCDNLRYEKSLWDKGVDLVAGVDEVGRGALAGPMVVGAVILKMDDFFRHCEEHRDEAIPAKRSNPNDQSTYNDIYSQIKDSKLLSPKRRAELSSFIIQNCLCYSIFQVSAQEIDTLGISACTQKAFFGAVKALKIAPEHILTDAFPIKAFPNAIQTNIVAGDRASLTISAASIVAKVFRDSLMCHLGNQSDYINYGFAQHKGYGTKLHFEKIVQHGISDIHRQTFIHF